MRQEGRGSKGQWLIGAQEANPSYDYSLISFTCKKTSSIKMGWIWRPELIPRNSFFSSIAAGVDCKAACRVLLATDEEILPLLLFE